MSEYAGGCHCGNITVTFVSLKSAADFTPRACDCSFCRKHSTRALSDPGGHIYLNVQREADLNRYQFGTKATEFLICRSCGVYVSAYMPDGDLAFANVLASVLDNHDQFGPGEPTDYGNEDEAGKRARRRQKWTPATLTVTD